MKELTLNIEKCPFIIANNSGLYSLFILEQPLRNFYKFCRNAGFYWILRQFPCANCIVDCTCRMYYFLIIQQPIWFFSQILNVRRLLLNIGTISIYYSVMPQWVVFFVILEIFWFCDRFWRKHSLVLKIKPMSIYHIA